VERPAKPAKSHDFAQASPNVGGLRRDAMESPPSAARIGSVSGYEVRVSVPSAPPEPEHASLAPGTARRGSGSPLRAALLTACFGLAAGLVFLFWPALGTSSDGQLFPARLRLAAAASLAANTHVLPLPKPVAAPAPALIPAGPRADGMLARKGRSPIAGALLTIPPAFASADGAYDLVIHFHGNTNLVEESFAASGLNAVVMILNLGVGSGAYEDRFANAMPLTEMLERARTTLERRGLRGARLRRLGLSAWSAGYGAILRILEQPALAEKVDAVVLFDGIHCGYAAPGSHTLLIERIAPFLRFAEHAAKGNRLFSITHSNIIPSGDYAGTRETTDALLRDVGAPRTTFAAEPPLPHLAAMQGVMPRRLIVPLQPLTEAHLGDLTVRGYSGERAEQHIMHLVQMSKTALPDLVRRWSAPAPR
jgi:hypothetical protein